MQSQFGDYQTPYSLAWDVCQVLAKIAATPRSIVEPTCGKGSFLRAAESVFSSCDTLRGYEINDEHVTEAMRTVQRSLVQQSDFFLQDWDALLDSLEEPLLLLGNPPWVTNSAIGRVGGENLPYKSNALGLRGIEAITGKSNFDISEWMITRLLESLSGHRGALAMLCKTSVARKVIRKAWDSGLEIEKFAMFRIDALKAFQASVSACLLVCVARPSSTSSACAVFPSLHSPNPESTFSSSEGKIIADVELHKAHGHLQGEFPLKWRSGIKHDCAKVMELRPDPNAMEPGRYINGFGEAAALESEVMYPMLKSSDLMKGSDPARFMLVTQRRAGDDTKLLAKKFPLAWAYLMEHSDSLDSRASSIYRRRPRFSMFGIGEYSFAPWKVAISGFTKVLDFKVVSPTKGKPVVLDDTCYFLPCESELIAHKTARLLNSDLAEGFFRSRIFWDVKRPVTVGTLASLDLKKLESHVLERARAV